MFEYTNSVIDILPDEVESSKTIWINQRAIQENESLGLYLFSLPQFYKEEIKKTEELSNIYALLLKSVVIETIRYSSQPPVEHNYYLLCSKLNLS